MDENYEFLKEEVKLTNEQIAGLVEDYREGGEKSNGAFEALVKSQGPWILKCVNQIDAPPGVSQEDMISEVMIVLINALKIYDPSIAKLSTYIASVIRRHAGKIILDNSPHSNGSPTDIGQYIEMSHERTLENSDWFHELCLQLLDDQERYIVLLRSKGFDFRQIARRVGFHHSWVSRKFHGAVEKLREGVRGGLEGP